MFDDGAGIPLGKRREAIAAIKMTCFIRLYSWFLMVRPQEPRRHSSEQE
jgi:hypothetical protein